MSNEVLSFLTQIIATGIGGWIAFKAVAKQNQAIQKIEIDKSNKAHAVELLNRIDCYVNCSFRADVAKEERQLQQRLLLTQVALVYPQCYKDTDALIKRVDNYHYSKKGIHFTELEDYFVGIKGEVFQRHFGSDLI